MENGPGSAALSWLCAASPIGDAESPLLTEELPDWVVKGWLHQRSSLCLAWRRCYRRSGKGASTGETAVAQAVSPCHRCFTRACRTACYRRSGKGASTAETAVAQAA